METERTPEPAAERSASGSDGGAAGNLHEMAKQSLHHVVVGYVADDPKMRAWAVGHARNLIGVRIGEVTADGRPYVVRQWERDESMAGRLAFGYGQNIHCIALIVLADVAAAHVGELVWSPGWMTDIVEIGADVGRSAVIRILQRRKLVVNGEFVRVYQVIGERAP